MASKKNNPLDASVKRGRGRPLKQTEDLRVVPLRLLLTAEEEALLTDAFGGRGISSRVREVALTEAALHVAARKAARKRTAE